MGLNTRWALWRVPVISPHTASATPPHRAHSPTLSPSLSLSSSRYIAGGTAPMALSIASSQLSFGPSSSSSSSPRRTVLAFVARWPTPDAHALPHPISFLSLSPRLELRYWNRKRRRGGSARGRKPSEFVVSASSDYYSVLGVPKSADGKQIKAAYRRLARQVRPPQCLCLIRQTRGFYVSYLFYLTIKCECQFLVVWCLWGSGFPWDFFFIADSNFSRYMAYFLFVPIFFTFIRLSGSFAWFGDHQESSCWSLKELYTLFLVFTIFMEWGQCREWMYSFFLSPFTIINRKILGDYIRSL